MSNYTKGPWRYAEELSAIVFVQDHKVKTIADFGKTSLSKEEDRANAALIASAPDMLDALEAVDRAWVGDGIEMIEAVDLCLLAIAKAKGETE